MRDEYLVRMKDARREAALAKDTAQEAAWTKIADQWEALARQTANLDHKSKSEAKSWV